MTAAEFYKLVLALWGEEWRAGLKGLLERHGIKRSRQTLYNWQHGNIDVPDGVAFILEQAHKRRKQHKAKGIAP